MISSRGPMRGRSPRTKHGAEVEYPKLVTQYGPRRCRTAASDWWNLANILIGPYEKSSLEMDCSLYGTEISKLLSRSA